MLPDPNERLTPSQAHGRSRGLKAVPVIVVSVALALFGGLVGYTYSTSRSGGESGPVPLIKADPRPMKVKPEDPGGMDVPHQDKEIYNRLLRDGENPPPRVERLLPPPEAPLPRPVGARNEPEIPPPPPVEPPPDAVEVTQAQPAAPAARESSAPPAPTSLQTQASPTPAKSQSVPASAQSQTAAVSAPRAAAPAQEAAAPPVRRGYRVQLAALRSADEARQAWSRLQRMHPDLLGKLSSDVVRADLGAKGTFYRLQAGPLSDEAAARDLCRRLSEKKVGCLVVRP
ncbi:MAG TPA: SPOR domain-containing protein [Alphaproteobacteria bacterium]